MNPIPGTQMVEDVFVYEVDFASLAGTTSAVGNFQVQADSSFKWVKAAYFADIAAAIQTDSSRVVPLATVQITDSGTGRSLFSSAIPIASFFGTGQLPFILPVQRIFAPNSNVAITVANLTAATTYNIRLSFIGTKLFQMS